MLKAKYWIPLILGLSLILGVVCNLAAGSPHYLPPVKYGQAFTLYFNVFDSNSPWRFYATAPAAADVHIIKDGGTAAAPTNSITDLGKTFSLVLTATEMQAAVVIVEVNDLSSPGLYMDDSWAIPTYGHTLALSRLDLDAANVSADVNTIKGENVTDGNGTGVLPVNVVMWTGETVPEPNVSGTPEVDAVLVGGEIPEADVIDTILDVNNNLEAEIAAVQADVDTIEEYTDDIEGYLDTEIALILAELAEADANNLLTKTAALAAQTAAEKLDTASELRTLLNASGGEVANEPNQTLILADTAAMDTASELRLLLNDSGGEVANEPNQTLILADTAAMDTASELRLLLNDSGGEVANEPNQTLMPSAVWDVDLTTKTVRNTAGWILNALKRLLF